MGITPFHIFAKDFESDRAGEPAALVCQRYQEASASMKQRGVHITVLVINDIDAGIGHWGHSVQYTVNTQLAISTLMSIADFPTRVGDMHTERVPIIVTGNDFTKLYSPLVREGRMTTFKWSPTFDEKVAVVRQNIFTQATLTDDDVRRLVLSHPDRPLAFFANLKSCLLDDILLDHVKKHGIEQCIPLVKTLFETVSSICDFDIEFIIQKASVLAEDKVIDHLQF